MLHKIPLFLLKTLFLFLFLFIATPAFAADIIKKDPLWFISDDAWLSYDEVKQMLMPNAFWCFEEENQTCSFFTIAKGKQKIGEQSNSLKKGQSFAYNVIELWENNLILLTPTGGVLRSNGWLCERGISWIDNILAYDLKEKPASIEQLKEIKDELWRDWEVDKNTQYCFSYAKINPNQPEIITQFEYENGVFNGYSLDFIMDYKPDAKIRYKLRLD